LVERLPEFSRSRLQGLIKDGYVAVDGVPAKKAGQKLEPGSQVEVHIPPPVPSGLVGEDIPLDILFEDDDLLVVNKPAGMVVHPAAGHDTGTLVHAVLGYDPHLEGIGGEERPGVVHRLDKETSGLILLAKNDRAHGWLQDQFRLRKVEKVYLALVDGAPPTPNGRVEAPIGRDPSHRKKMAIMPAGKGREAVSEYRYTGIVQRAYALGVPSVHRADAPDQAALYVFGLPDCGDKIYGHRKQSIAIDRHFLHAAKLKIILPGKTQPQTFEAPLPC
jgi:23S rRNA pseudouridine1911/1915/1917 synthase